MFLNGGSCVTLRMDYMRVRVKEERPDEKVESESTAVAMGNLQSDHRSSAGLNTEFLWD